MSETDVAIGAIAALQKQVAGLQTHNEVLYRDNVALSEVADRLREALERITCPECEYRSETARSIARAALAPK